MAGSSVSPVVDSGAAAPTETGRYAILEQLLADDIHYIFGNPGTVEQGFLDALGNYPDLNYILTLQETIAVAIADGYARARHRPAVVQLHSGVGLGNGIGMLYQAKRGGSPLVVIAGESGIRYDAMDAQMAADLVSIAKPVTKWATRVVDPGSVLRVLRRAIKIAGTAPTGPVFVALPADVLDALERGADRRVVDAGDANRPGCAADRPGRHAPGRRHPTDHHHGRRGRDVRCPGRADTGRRAARGGRLGRQLVRGQHRRDPPALPRQPRPHVRPPQHAAGRGGGRRPDRRHLRLPRGLPDADDRLRAGRAGRPHRPRRLRDREELPGRPRAGQRSEADPRGARRGPRRAADQRPPARMPAGGSTVAGPSANRPRPRCATPTSRRAARSRSTRPSSWRRWPAVCRTTRSSSTRR